MKGFCESCGRYPSLSVRLRGEGLARSDEGVYLCGSCRGLGSSGVVVGGGSQRRRAAWTTAGIMAIAILVGLPLSASLFTSRERGAVQGIAQEGPSSRPPVASSSDVAEPSHPPPAESVAPRAPAPSSSQAPTSPPASAEPVASPNQPTPTFSVGEATARAWQGPYGETRLQVIVPVRNDDARWLALPRSSSSYRVVDQEGREVASGVFTTALPAAVPPGATGYLVDTVSVTFIVPSGAQSVVADVRAILTDAPVVSISVSDLSAAIGPGGGLQVTGQVQNEGGTATKWVVAGAVALAPDGTPLGAVYDPSDIGRLEPGQALAFDTEYPGAPPPSAGVIDALVGMAFETAP